MKAVVFDGVFEVAKREAILRKQVDGLAKKPTMVSFYFREDLASVLYTRLKKEAALRVGIGFMAVEQSFADNIGEIKREIRKFNEDENVQGVMIQKPAKSVWHEFFCHPEALPKDPEDSSSRLARLRMTDVGNFNRWWRGLADTINPTKDVDCLTSANLTRVENGTWKIVPATVKGVLTILGGIRNNELEIMGQVYEGVSVFVKDKRVVVVGRSEIGGKPLAAVLLQMGARVALVGSSEQNLRELTLRADIIVSATGRVGLINGDMIKAGAIVIDVGSPRGDVHFPSVVTKASFITPVPDGVGPMTVVSLLENLTELVKL